VRVMSDDDLVECSRGWSQFRCGNAGIMSQIRPRLDACDLISPAIAAGRRRPLLCSGATYRRLWRLLMGAKGDYSRQHDDRSGIERSRPEVKTLLDLCL
jgi:hypothetical protein